MHEGLKKLRQVFGFQTIKLKIHHVKRSESNEIFSKTIKADFYHHSVSRRKTIFVCSVTILSTKTL